MRVAKTLAGVVDLMIFVWQARLTFHASDAQSVEGLQSFGFRKCSSAGIISPGIHEFVCLG